MENLIPPKTEELGIDYESLKNFNDKLIYASVTGFGHEGPLRSKAAFDLTIQAMSGYMNITGPPE